MVPRSSHSRGTPAGRFGVVQPGRLADRRPGVATGRRRSGTPGVVPRSSHSRGTPARSLSASFSPDGSRIVTAEWRRDGEGLGREEWRRGPHTQGAHRSVTSASFSPDGSRIVTASGDGTAKVWDAKSGAEVLTLKGHTDRVFSASFSPDGSRIVTGSADTDGEGLGRQDWCRGPHAQGAHRLRPFGVVQPGRLADRDRESRTRRRRSGTPRVVPRSSHSRGTPAGRVRRRSARTARGSSPAVGARQRRSGMPLR